MASVNLRRFPESLAHVSAEKHISCTRGSTPTQVTGLAKQGNATPHVSPRALPHNRVHGPHILRFNQGWPPSVAMAMCTEARACKADRGQVCLEGSFEASLHGRDRLKTALERRRVGESRGKGLWADSPLAGSIRCKRLDFPSCWTAFFRRVAPRCTCAAESDCEPRTEAMGTSAALN